MERSARVRRSRSLSCRPRLSPYPLRSYRWNNAEEGNQGRKRMASLALEKKDWEGATCSVCMEYPHNAVLLLCSSHDKGCRPYMCGTSYRHSNCLDQFKKAYTKVHDLESVRGEHATTLGLFTGGSGGLPLSSSEKPEIMELAACPLCRGQVKGWTVVEPARKYLNNKKRSCMQDNCSFVGTYKELRKHVRSAHPCAKPREVDPTLQQKWSRLEHEREHQDVISTIRSSMPRSVVFGDYVIEMADSDDSDEDGVMGGDGVVREFEGGNRDIGRSILYFFLREGARFMRLHRDPDGVATNLEGRDDDAGRIYGLPSMAANGENAVAASAYFSGDDDYVEDPVSEGGVGILRSERRRRRRRRSRVRSVGLS